MPNLLDDIRAIVGTKGIVSAEDAKTRQAVWGHDYPLLCQALIRPASTKEVAAVVALCNAADQKVVPYGGGTGLVGSFLSDGSEIFISLERMNTIEKIDTADNTVVVQAGTPLQRVHEAAEAVDLIYPVDLGSRGSCTIGGNLATNAGGNEVIAYGMTRNQVLGTEVVLADGTILNSMKALIKDNSGYDLKQLFIGSEGTLGIITKVLLKLQPRPTTCNTAMLVCDSFGDVKSILGAAKAKFGGQLNSFEVMWKNFIDFMATDPNMQIPQFDGTHQYYILVEVKGTDPSNDEEKFIEGLGEIFESGCVADAVIAKSHSEGRNLWAIRDNIAHTIRLAPYAVFDISVPLGSMEAYLDTVNQQLNQQLPDHTTLIFGHIGDGNLHIITSVPDLDEAAKAVINAIVYGNLKSYTGSISAEHGVGLEKKPYLSNSRSQAEIDVMRKIKQALDPKNTLSPGRIFD